MRFARYVVGSTLSILLMAVALPAPVAAVSPGTPGPIVFAKWSAADNDYFLWTIVPGGEPVKIPNTQGTRAARWSPDGRLLAYTIYNQGVFLINADGSGKRNIVPPAAGRSYGNPVWSPDGTRLAYGVTEGGSADGYIEIISSLTSEVEVLDVGIFDPWEWTDDFVLGSAWRDFERQLNADEEIARYDFEDSSFHFLTDSRAQQGVPRLSPDGRTVLFVSSSFVPTFSGYSIWLMDIDGDNDRKLVDMNGLSWPAWSPDGGRIVFGPTLETISPDGAERQSLGGWYGEDGVDWAPLAGTTEDFGIAGVRALALRDPAVIASATASTGTFRPTSTANVGVVAATPRSVTIRQVLGEPATATLRIYKPSGALMRTVNHGLRTGPVAYTWNGRLPSGSLAARGTYKFVARAVDLRGNVKKKTLYVTVVR